MLLFIAHAKFTPQEVKCRFYGPCAVTGAVLNGVTLSPLTEESHFVLSFSPLHHGKNELDIHTVKAPKSKVYYYYIYYFVFFLYHSLIN